MSESGPVREHRSLVSTPSRAGKSSARLPMRAQVDKHKTHRQTHVIRCQQGTLEQRFPVPSDSGPLSHLRHIDPHPPPLKPQFTAQQRLRQAPSERVPSRNLRSEKVSLLQSDGKRGDPRSESTRCCQTAAATALRPPLLLPGRAVALQAHQPIEENVLRTPNPVDSGCENGERIATSFRIIVS